MAALAALLAACSGLPQAPLVYASRSTVGLDLSTSSTETPGGSVSIGVKVVDYAYVPVAVARNQRSARGDGDYDDIERIVAVYGEGTTAAGLDALSQENRAKLDEYIKSRKALDDFDAAAAELSRQRDRARRQLAAAQAQSARLAAERALLSPSPAASTEEAAASAGRLQATTQALQEASAEADKAQRQLEETAPRWESLATQRQPLVEGVERNRKAAAEVVSVLRTEKQDAMSVYGRFNTTADVPAGAASAPSLSANLTAGKIFSTGVASQNLTEAVRQEAALTAMGRCLEGVAKVAAVAASAAASAAAVSLIQQLSAECRSSVNGGQGRPR
jgi:hypothetical protein